MEVMSADVLVAETCWLLYLFTFARGTGRTIMCAIHIWPGPWFNKKMLPYQYRKSHCGEKTVVRSSYLHKGISYTGKMASFYWIRPWTFMITLVYCWHICDALAVFVRELIKSKLNRLIVMLCVWYHTASTNLFSSGFSKECWINE